MIVICFFFIIARIRRNVSYFFVKNMKKVRGKKQNMVQFSISDRGGNRCGKSKREGTFCTAGSTEGSDWKAGSDRDGDESIFGGIIFYIRQGR